MIIIIILCPFYFNVKKNANRQAVMLQQHQHKIRLIAQKISKSLPKLQSLVLVCHDITN